MAAHKERKHSKFSASGAEIWFNCQGSVAASEGAKDKDTPWSIEGTKAHEVLEELMTVAIASGVTKIGHAKFDRSIPHEMVAHATNATNFILALKKSLPQADIMVETRVYLDFIHPEMFGTFDGAVVDQFGTLHVFDYKYGKSAVSPQENLQMIFYGIGLAHIYKWNFKKVRLWIIQPRIRGYDGPVYWEISAAELREYVKTFKTAVDMVGRYPDKFNEGSWCHWCKGKAKCPLKNEKRKEKESQMFEPIRQ